MDLKALNAYSLENVEKGQLYEVYNHYLTTLDLSSLKSLPSFNSEHL